MKPLKVLVYQGLVSAMKAQGVEPKTELATLVNTEFGATADEVGCVVFETGIIGFWPLSRLEVLPGQFPTEKVISIDVPGALDMDLKE